MLKKHAAVIIFTLCAVLTAQEAGNAVLPRGYGDVALGMGIDELKNVLRGDANYLFREDRDVYFMPLSDENYVETTGRGFVKRAFFQFEQQKLFVFTMQLNPDSMDYYSIFMTFLTKYGEPSALDPQKAVWESDETRVLLERPLSVKYIDKQVFDSLSSASSAGKSKAVIIREDFINKF